MRRITSPGNGGGGRSLFLSASPSRCKGENTSGNARATVGGVCGREPAQPLRATSGGWRELADKHQWQAELSRASGASDPTLWSSVAELWEAQHRVHRAAYCWWRMAQAQVDHGQSPTKIAPTLQRAWELSVEMAPLRAAVEEIALRANVRLTTAPAAQDPAPVELPVALTERELEILRHVAAGRCLAGAFGSGCARIW